MTPKNFLIAVVLLCTNVCAQTVSNLHGFYRSGQVFLTWNKIADATAYYKVYRSTSAITTAGQLPSCEYLGYTNSKSSVNHNLTQHDGIVRYLRIDSAGTPLNSSTGLFVATTLVNGNYYYAVTTLINNVENTTITSGLNTLSNSIAETVSKPLPVFQEERIVGLKVFDIYTTFQSSKYAAGQSLWLNAGFFPSDFAVHLNNATGNNPVRFFFHGGGEDYIDNVTVTDTNEVRVQIEDEYPDSTVTTAWWGSNPAYDIYNSANNVAPVSGVNNNFSQQRVSNIIDWVIHNLPVDSNRIYLDATSDGSGPAFFYAITFPGRIAAIKVHVGSFNFSFLNDWQANCSLNTGKKNRLEGDKRLGTVVTNLMCNLGIHTYEALNGGWMIHQYPAKEYPVIYSINGKQDKLTGWTEKTIWYDSVNTNHFGSYFFWDNRDHGGNGKTWGLDNFNLYRYRRNSSYPAFSFCSLNEDYGTGSGLTGADHGSVNGTLDWSDNIIDSTRTWKTKVFVHNLIDQNGTIIVYPDSCTADITPRRLQHFTLTPGSTINWQVIHQGVTIQSGSLNYQGGLIVIPQAKIFRDTSTIVLINVSLVTYYRDNDVDGYGDPLNSIQSGSQPQGYVTNNTDCNDQNAQVHPGVPDVCNGIDDNCNSATDENAISATVTPTGSVSACKGTSFTLTANGGSGITYQWLKNSQNISGATAQTYVPAKSASFSVRESNSFSCTSTSAQTSVTLFNQPAATITPQGNLDICQTGSVVLHANSGSGLTYQWQKGSTILAGATNQDYTATAAAAYKVIVTNSHNCNKVSMKTTVTKSCRESEPASVSNEGEITIHPVPNNGQFEMVFKNFKEGNSGIISVTDLSGKRIYYERVEISSEVFSKEISLGNVPDGVFLAEFLSDGVKYVQMIVVTKDKP